jgi:hypothetical protein
MKNTYSSLKKLLNDQEAEREISEIKGYINRSHPDVYLKEFSSKEHEFMVDRAKELIDQMGRISEYIQTISVINLADRLSVDDPEKWMSIVQETSAFLKENNDALLAEVKQLLNRVQYSGPIDRDMAFDELNTVLMAVEARIAHYQPLLEMHMLKSQPDFAITKIGILQ